MLPPFVFGVNHSLGRELGDRIGVADRGFRPEELLCSKCSIRFTFGYRQHLPLVKGEVMGFHGPTPRKGGHVARGKHRRAVILPSGLDNCLRRLARERSVREDRNVSLTELIVEAAERLVADEQATRADATE
jgi:hypothetical protein